MLGEVGATAPGGIVADMEGEAEVFVLDEAVAGEGIEVGEHGEADVRRTDADAVELQSRHPRGGEGEAVPTAVALSGLGEHVVELIG